VNTPVPPYSQPRWTAGHAPPPAAGIARKGSGARRKALWFLVITLALLSGAAGGAEFYVRNTAEQAIDKTARCLVDDGASTSFGWRPLLMGYFSTGIGQLHVRTDGNQIRKAKKMAIDLTMTDVALDKGPAGSVTTVGHTEVTVSWPTSGIAESAHGIMPPLGSMITSAEAAPAKGEITLKLAGMLHVNIKPVIANGQVALKLAEMSAGIPGLARDAVQPALDRFTKNAVGTYPLGLKADTVSVTANGLEVHLSSRNQTFKAGAGSDAEPCLSNLNI